MNTLKDMIKKEQNKEQQLKLAQNDKEQVAFHVKLNELKPMFEQIKEGLAETGFEVSLHVDTTHWPCPAIHIKSTSWYVRDRISEICRESGEGEWLWFAGACNAHNYKHSSDDALLRFIAETIAHG